MSRQRAMSPTRRPSARRACGVSSSVSRMRAAAVGQRHAVARARAGGCLRDRLVAQPALGDVDDAFEGEVVGGLVDDAQIGERVADLGALVEAEAADDAVRHADRDEAVLELAGLVLRRGPGSRCRRATCRCAARPRSPRRRGAPPRGRPRRRCTRTFSPASSSVHSVLPSRPLLLAMTPPAAPRMCGVER